MGCLHSKKETSDLHPNVFRVVNIDENGAELCSGQLEITENDIVLYREGRDTTVWPLHSLRRYGFEGEIFSFESGRRCETGEGIYAFRCRRASFLFHSLQQQIQLRNVIHGSVSYPVSRLTGTPSPQTRQTLQATVVHRSSVDNGQPVNDLPVANNNLDGTSHVETAETITQSPRSPSSADILEVMPLYPQSRINNSHVRNVYQLREFKREHNNNQTEIASDSQHLYCNDINRDLAILRNTLKQEAALNTMRDIEDETRFLESRYINECAAMNHVNSLSPTISSSSEHYAQLNIDQQEPIRLYMNIKASEKFVYENKHEIIPITPLTPKQVEYCNLSIGMKPEINTYANLSLGNMIDSVKNAKMILSCEEHRQKFSESDTFQSISPVEELEVNYAVLDIDTNKESSKNSQDLTSPENQSYNSSKHESTTASCSSQIQRGRVLSQSSIEKPLVCAASTNMPPANVGYTTIDFDKTVALTSVAAGADADMNAPRKTRLNSSNLVCGSPNNVDKSKANN